MTRTSMAIETTTPLSSSSKMPQRKRRNRLAADDSNTNDTNGNGNNNNNNKTLTVHHYHHFGPQEHKHIHHHPPLRQFFHKKPKVRLLVMQFFFAWVIGLSFWEISYLHSKAQVSMQAIETKSNKSHKTMVKYVRKSRNGSVKTSLHQRDFLVPAAVENATSLAKNTTQALSSSSVEWELVKLTVGASPANPNAKLTAKTATAVKQQQQKENTAELTASASQADVLIPNAKPAAENTTVRKPQQQQKQKQKQKDNKPYLNNAQKQKQKDNTPDLNNITSKLETNNSTDAQKQKQKDNTPDLKNITSKLETKNSTDAQTQKQKDNTPDLKNVTSTLEAKNSTDTQKQRQIQQNDNNKPDPNTTTKKETKANNNNKKNNRKAKEEAQRRNMLHSWCPQPFSSKLESPKLVKASDYVSEESTDPNDFHYVSVNYTSVYKSQIHDEILKPVPQSVTYVKNETIVRKKLVDHPVVRKAAICKIRPQLTAKLQHFAHAMEAIYQCFDYWIDSGVKHRSNSSGFGPGVTPVLLYDHETQGKFLMHDSFLKNFFMKGIKEFLTSQIDMRVLRTDDYYRCHYQGGNTSEQAADLRNYLNLTEEGLTTVSDHLSMYQLDVCRSLYHEEQTIRTYDIDGSRGYLFQHSFEWNRNMDSWLERKRNLKKKLNDMKTRYPPTDKELREILLEEKRNLKKAGLKTTSFFRDRRDEAKRIPVSGGRYDDDNHMSGSLKEMLKEKRLKKLSQQNIVEDLAKEKKENKEKEKPAASETTRRRLTEEEPNSSKPLTAKGVLEGACAKPPKIAILNRKKTRTILNADDLAADLSELVYVYGKKNSTHTSVGVAAAGNRSTPLLTFNYTSPSPVEVAYFEQKSFVDQVEFFRNADILITGHGAGLTGLPFMANGLETPDSKSCKQVLEFYPKNYALPYYFGSLAIQSGIGHNYVYYDDGLDDDFLYENNKYNSSDETPGQATRARPPLKDLKMKRTPLVVLKPWERAQSNDYKLRIAARKFKFCPRRDDFVEYVAGLVLEWYRCHGC